MMTNDDSPINGLTFNKNIVNKELQRFQMYKIYENKKISWKKTVLNHVAFDLPDYYVPVKLSNSIFISVGSGAYGAVAAAVDTRLPEEQRQQKMLAIKKMTNAFEHRIYTRRIFRELRLLRLLKFPTIIQLKTIVLPRSRLQFQDIYAVFELIDSDMTTILKKQREKEKQKQQLRQEHYQYFTYQIMIGLKFIHEAKVVHRDLKPRNLLLQQNCDLKICDFGLARQLGTGENHLIFTDYVATRWYRAPQLLLGETKYTPAIDIWSVGCILAEMILKKPFLPATSTESQLQLILQAFDFTDLDFLKQKNHSQYQTLRNLTKNRIKKNNMIESKIKGQVSDNLLDFLKKTLKINPGQRLTAEQALKHPFLSPLQQQFSHINNKPIPIDPLQFQFDNYSLTTQQLKDMIYQQILLYHFPEFIKEYYAKLKRKESIISHIIQKSTILEYNPITDGDDD